MGIARDHGAHFYCCDFQIHSPRDENWIGPRPTSDEERKIYATEFIAACRAKGLDAVAITDHHDVAFLSYIKDASLTELKSDGSPISPSDAIVIFPGIEITLGIGCQALLLFDPDITAEALSRALTILEIEPFPPESATTAPTVRLRAEFTPITIAERFAAQPLLVGRFILLPNVNGGGEDTILRHGFQEHYKAMRCVGGYVDGSLAQHGRSNIIEGKDPGWGNKRIGVFQTSDNRQRDFAKLGVARTWVKWSTPSAEALRQACLAPDSRLRYQQPGMPDSWIERISVSQSKYFGAFEINFNPQANMIIGGRGSGKSSILEYLRWALCDQPQADQQESSDEIPDYDRRRQSLVSATLKDSGGEVTVEYVENSVPHAIRRDAGTGKVFLKVGEQEEQQTTEQFIQSFASIQGYSQKQLSHVSVRTEELLRLVTAPISPDLTSIEERLAKHANEIRLTFQQEETRLQFDSKLRAIELERSSLVKQADILKAQITDLPANQKKAIEEHPYLEKGNRIALDLEGTLGKARDELAAAKQRFRQQISQAPEVQDALPADIVAGLRAKLIAALEDSEAQLENVIGGLDRAASSFKDDLQVLQALIASNRVEYSTATSTNTSIQHNLEQFRVVSTQVSSLSYLRDELKKPVAELGDTAGNLRKARDKWLETLVEQDAILKQQAENLTETSKGVLRVIIQRGLGVEHLRELLVDAVRGASITTPDKFDQVISGIKANPQPVQRWIEVTEELISLARIAPQLGSGTPLPECRFLTEVGFGEAELRRMASKLTVSNAFDLSLQFPRSYPAFEYQTTGGDYIPFEAASPGQQANALLTLLFNQSAGPLLIDQPEDDLDMSTVSKVSEHLWTAKENRQIIFTTHNANLLVIGDAELVVHCDYVPPPGPAKVCVALTGAIDQRSVRETVTKVVEGGEDAFKLRMNRYGF